jgi:hypothetical protein
VKNGPWAPVLKLKHEMRIPKDETNPKDLKANVENGRAIAEHPGVGPLPI